MKLEKCANGHFYDAEKYATCPHCAGGVPDETQGLNDNIDSTQSLKAEPSGMQRISDLEQGLADLPISRGRSGEETVPFYQAKLKSEPTVGWLICTKGVALGKDFRLKTGKNFIGRDKEMDVVLSGENTVSRLRHAIVVFEPKNNLFLAQPGESKELYYLNGNVVLTPVQMHKNDVLSIGDVELMLIPCCDEKFNWNDLK